VLAEADSFDEGIASSRSGSTISISGASSSIVRSASAPQAFQD